MKKLRLFTLSLLTGCLLTSCTAGGKDSSTGSENAYRILINGDSTVDLSCVVSAITADCGRMVNIFTDERAAEPSELVFGDTGRPISALAASELDSLIASADGVDTGYVIYKSEDGSIAVVWNDENAAALAVADFAQSYCSAKRLAAEPVGVIGSYTFNLDSYLYDKAWARLEATAPPDVLAALKRINAFYDGSAIADWVASLWEPYICICGNCKATSAETACLGGGFYYAISSRDNEGFLPDLESTSQALGILVNNGAFAKYKNSYPNAISDRMKELIVVFCQKLQDEDDGYFYHPQWGKNVGLARSGRDLSWAVNLLRNCGGEPLYPTALDRLNGASGSSATLERSLTSPLALSRRFSEVLPAASFSDYLKSEESYMSWLESTTKNIFENTDGAHTINAVWQQIRAAGYLELTVDYLDERLDALYAEMSAAYAADPEHNPRPTGLWQRHVDYNAVWGLLKLAPLYDAAGRPLKYPVSAMRTCVEVILIDADAGYYYMNDVYNQWSAAASLINITKRYYPEKIDEMRAIAAAHAPEMIDNSIRKVGKFKQADGTFGYNQGTSAPYTQGVHVSLGLPEGDINATGLACSMYRSCFIILGYDAVPLCDYRDGERVLEAMNSATERAYGRSE